MDVRLLKLLLCLPVPPEKPKNLSCMVHEEKRMTCQWDPGRGTHLETDFTLKSEWQVTTPWCPGCCVVRWEQELQVSEHVINLQGWDS